ncbi:MAG: MFS transporter [Ruminococcaceae bacterium]|nr:MFS transporter [Oscillospiraceae bacterium]
MERTDSKSYLLGFVPYALAAFLIGIIGGFTTALGPAFVKDLGLDYNNTTWTALAMSISTAAFAPILGKLGDVIGRRVTLLLGILIFIFGNIMTAVAPSLWFMLAARFVVGIGSAAIAPVVIAYIIGEFPPDRASGGFSLYMLISSAAVIFGPTLGGIVINRWGWRVMMWICVAISAVVFVACLLTNKEKEAQKRSLSSFDGLGSVFVLIFFSLMLCVPSFGQNFGWNSAAFVFVLIAAVLSLVVLILVERKAKTPILQGGFMKRRSFVLSVAALFLTQGLMQANMTNIIVFVNYTQPENTVISGYAISIMYIGMSLGSILLGPLADKFEPKRILSVSFVITGIGCALMLLFSPITSILLLAASLGFLGFGLGANATIFMRVVLSGISTEKAGAATGTYGLFRDLAAPFGVAVFVPLFTNRVTANINMGVDEISAVLNSIKLLAITEIICVAVGLVAVVLLPKIHMRKEIINEAKG